jgi:hypothetical protein
MYDADEQLDRWHHSIVRQHVTLSDPLPLF